VARVADCLKLETEVSSRMCLGCVWDVPRMCLAGCVLDVSRMCLGILNIYCAVINGFYIY